ncbi:phospholipase D-like domain-containing protein DpdK [Saccharothrix variisporea]|uniref:Phospholipase D-like protein n=1 Tax=Saccharothrix variisporea TaxID=543527 RepID=A0A495XKY3_9PSEU|nr:phospholipase D-like domain-containing protein DpdK [Saccharothrix variisporea]RKT74319.1 phospholipase D-like protein [Saccharothrix variisporea]
MRGLERTVRTGPKLRLSADTILADALLSELVAPGPVLWVVSAWISNVEVIDNTQGSFDDILGDDHMTHYRLVDVLAKLARSGTPVRVVTRPTTHNQLFVDQMKAIASDDADLAVVFDPVEHEKTVCGRDWMISGSMNFTASGIGANEESVRYVVDNVEVAQARIDFVARWGGIR